MRSELKGAARKEFLHCPPCMSSAGCPSLSYSAFRPTLHMRAATRLLSQLPVYTVISTRAPHEVERPPSSCIAASRKRYFNPRSPCGERLPLLTNRGYNAGNFNPRSLQKSNHIIVYYLFRRMSNFNLRPRQSSARKGVQPT